MKALLRVLDDRLCPTYWLKTVRIFCFINDLLMEDIYLFMTEKFLKYETSFVASTSDFWWDIVRKKSFGARIGKFVANRHMFKNGLSIFVSDTTIKSVYKGSI